MVLTSKTGFQHNTDLTYFKEEQSSEDVKRRAKVYYVVEKLSGILDLSEEKERQAKDLYDRNLAEQLDEVALGAGLVHVASKQRPVKVRWRRLVAEGCKQLVKDEGRVAQSYNSTYWERELDNVVKKLQGRGISGNVTKIDYLQEFLKYYDLSEDVEDFAVKIMYLASVHPSFSGKKPVPLAGAVVRLGWKLLEEDCSEHKSFEEVAEDLCVDEETVKSYMELLESEIVERTEHF